MHHGASGIDISLVHKSSVAQHISSVAAAFSAAVSGIVTSPELTISNLELIGSQDLDRVRHWNSTEPQKVDARLHELVAQRVLQQPTASAVSAWDGDLTYAELDALSTKLAQRIFQHLSPTQGNSAGCSNQFIPICFEKSMWAIVAMLGILKAGCSFVPLDSKHPKSRIDHILKQTQATIVITSGELSASLELPRMITPIILGGDSATDSTSSAVWISSDCSSSDIAYLIFTSGSTGTPKGVVLEHGAASKSFSSFRT